MGRLAVVSCALSATIAACFIKPDRPGNGPGDGGIDSNTDAAPSGDCKTACGWGCIGSGSAAHCGVIDPVGGGVVASDLDTTGLADNIEIDGTIDGDTGSIGTARLAGSGVSQGIEYKVVGNVAIFRFNSVRVGGTFTLAGSHPIALVAGGAITIDGPVNASGDCINNDAGPGGFSGGLRGSTTLGPGAGSLANGMSGGGGGGGHAGSGGNGGAKTDPPAVGGAVFGDLTITVLAGGGGGGAGYSTAAGGFGGGGGGAIQLVSSTSITVTANAMINAGGCGGKKTNNMSPGGGGGAGGTIVLEAPVVTLAGPIGANGGGGAGGDSQGQDGQNGITDLVGASGGAGAVSAQYGGSGAAGSDVNGVAAVGGAASSGGGGGAAGRIRFTTKSGQVAGTGTITPTLGSPGAKAFTATVR